MQLGQIKKRKKSDDSLHITGTKPAPLRGRAQSAIVKRFGGSWARLVLEA